MVLETDSLIHFRINLSNPIIGYLNINSLRNKKDDLREVYEKLQIDILCVNENKRYNSFLESKFKSNRYQFCLLRRDRDNKRGEKLAFLRRGLIANKLKQRSYGHHLKPTGVHWKVVDRMTGHFLLSTVIERLNVQPSYINLLLSCMITTYEKSLNVMEVNIS